MKHLLLFLSIPLLFSCSKDVYKSIYVQNQKAPDQIPVDSFIYDSKNKIWYAISNNQKNLYVNFRITEEKQQRQLMALGMTIWLDTLNKRNEAFGLKFPYQSMQGMIPQHGQPLESSENRVPEFMGFTDMLIYGLDGKGSENLANTNNPLGITAKMKMDTHNILYYTAILPLKYVGKSTFSLGYEIVKPEMGARPEMGKGPMDGGAGMRSGHRGSGGGRPGMGPQGGNPATHVFVPIWIKNIALDTNGAF